MVVDTGKIGWYLISWWLHQMESFSALLAICAGNSPVAGEFTPQRPVTRSFDVCLNKRLSKQSWGWWFETPSRPLWRHSNVAKHHFGSMQNVLHICVDPTVHMPFLHGPCVLSIIHYLAFTTNVHRICSPFQTYPVALIHVKSKKIWNTLK